MLLRLILACLTLACVATPLPARPGLAPSNGGQIEILHALRLGPALEAGAALLQLGHTGLVVDISTGAPAGYPQHATARLPAIRDIANGMTLDVSLPSAVRRQGQPAMTCVGLPEPEWEAWLAELDGTARACAAAGVRTLYLGLENEMPGGANLPGTAWPAHPRVLERARQVRDLVTSHGLRVGGMALHDHEVAGPSFLPFVSETLDRYCVLDNGSRPGLTTRALVRSWRQPKRGNILSRDPGTGRPPWVPPAHLQIAGAWHLDGRAGQNYRGWERRLTTDGRERGIVWTWSQRQPVTAYGPARTAAIARVCRRARARAARP